MGRTVVETKIGEVYVNIGRAGGAWSVNVDLMTLQADGSAAFHYSERNVQSRLTVAQKAVLEAAMNAIVAVLVAEKGVTAI